MKPTKRCRPQMNISISPTKRLQCWNECASSKAWHVSSKPRSGWQNRACVAIQSNSQAAALPCAWSAGAHRESNQPALPPLRQRRTRRQVAHHVDHVQGNHVHVPKLGLRPCIRRRAGSAAHLVAVGNTGCRRAHPAVPARPASGCQSADAFTAHRTGHAREHA